MVDISLLACNLLDGVTFLLFFLLALYLSNNNIDGKNKQLTTAFSFLLKTQEMAFPRP